MSQCSTCHTFKEQGKIPTMAFVFLKTLYGKYKQIQMQIDIPLSASYLKAVRAIL